MRRIQLRFPLLASRISSRLMTTSGYILPHQPGTTATATATVPGIDQLKLLSKLPKTEKPPKVGDTRIFYDVPEGNITALVSLGDKFASKQPNERREFVRRAVGSAVRELRNLEAVNRIEIDASADPHAACECFPRITVESPRADYTTHTAVGAHLARYKFTLKTSPPSKFDPNLEPPIPESLALEPLQSSKEWDTGRKYAEAQNWAKTVRMPYCLVLV